MRVEKLGEDVKIELIVHVSYDKTDKGKLDCRGYLCGCFCMDQYDELV